MILCFKNVCDGQMDGMTGGGSDPSNLKMFLFYFLFPGHANISEEHLAHARKWGTPVDCTWIIRAEEGKTIYLQFPHYQLNEPNDCNFNFIQIFDEKTDMEHRKRNFCGSVAEAYESQTNILFVRWLFLLFIDFWSNKKFDHKSLVLYWRHPIIYKYLVALITR